MPPSSLEEILYLLQSLANADNVAGMKRFGINPQNTLGVSIPSLRKLAREQGKDHSLALALWQSGIHEARLLASMIDDVRQVGEAQMEAWVQDFDSWDICDQVCGNLFDRTLFAYGKAQEWSARSEEFVKRAGFVLMAGLAVHDKQASNTAFEPFFPILKREACDERNFVKKAVNWALRGLGKRNRSLNRTAIQTAREIQELNCKAARWIAADALRELTSEKIQSKLKE
jgi:3-methyladenine DNA glycosylase AlkD